MYYWGSLKRMDSHLGYALYPASKPNPPVPRWKGEKIKNPAQEVGEGQGDGFHKLARTSGDFLPDVLAAFQS